MRHPVFFLLRGRKGGKRYQCFFSLHELFLDFHMLFAVRYLRVFDLFLGYQLKAGQPAKSGNCADRRKLFIAGLLPNSEASEPDFLSRLKLVAKCCSA